MNEAIKKRTGALNARTETVDTLPTFKNAFHKMQRCIIASTGYFEFHHAYGKKYPYFIKVKDENIFSMAGIWETWQDKETSKEYHSFAILTTDANPMLAKIHNDGARMPIVLPREKEKEWLSNQITLANIKDYFVQFPEEKLEAWTVNKKINSTKNATNFKEVTYPHIYPELEVKQGDLFDELI